MYKLRKQDQITIPGYTLYCHIGGYIARFVHDEIRDKLNLVNSTAMYYSIMHLI